jgi:hypothetical protein
MTSLLTEELLKPFLSLQIQYLYSYKEKFLLFAHTRIYTLLLFPLRFVCSLLISYFTLRITLPSSFVADMGDEKSQHPSPGDLAESIRRGPLPTPVLSNQIPNGGLTAWLQALGSFFMIMNSWYKSYSLYHLS